MPTLRGASRLLGRFFGSPQPRRRLVVACVVLVPWYRNRLRKRPFRELLAFTVQRPAGDGRERSAVAIAGFLHGASPEDIGWAVDRVGSRFRIDGPCLTLAMTALYLMTRLGYPSDLRIGVARGESSERTADLEAHAWLEYQGDILVGDLPDLDRYTPLPSFENVAL